MMRGLRRFLLGPCLFAGYLCFALVSCNPASAPEATAEPATEFSDGANRVAHFPQHLEEIETNRRFPSYGVLVLGDDGCLRLGKDPDASGGNLLVWPVGYHYAGDERTVRVLDHTGGVVAHVGDHIRISTIRNIWEPLPEPVVLLISGLRTQATVSEEALEHRRPLRPENHPWLPTECSGFWNAKIVGDEVTAFMPDEEPEVVPVPGSTLFFPRHSSMWTVLERHLLGRNGRLVLERDCLRLGPAGRLLVWPPGFTPHIENGEVSVRNGGGRTVARVGETMVVAGNDGPDYPGRCAGGGSYQIHEVKTNESD